MAQLTRAQRLVLAHFAKHHCGFMRFEGGWLKSDEVRRNPDLALRFIEDRAVRYRDRVLLQAWLAPDSGRRQ